MLADRIPAALRRLDPQRRALLELSFLRGVSDEEIAELLGVTPAEVQGRREGGVEGLSDLLGLEGAEERDELVERLRTMPHEEWGASAQPPAVAGADSAAPEAAVAAEPAEEPPEPEPGDPRRRTMRLAGIALALAALAVAAVVLVPTSEDSQRQGNGGEAAPTRVDPSARARLRPVANGRGWGVARLMKDGADERLLVSVRGLEPPGQGIYVVWLYRTVDDAVAIGGSKRTSFRLNARLPAGAARYPALDISLEPLDRNEAHGGHSVLRAPLAPLRRPD